MYSGVSQQTSESVEQFITRLRIQAETCEFGDRLEVNEQIRDQVIDKCVSHSLRRKLFEKGRTLQLDRVKEIAQDMEDSEKQARFMEGLKSDINKLMVRDKSKSNEMKGEVCFACGHQGHKARDPKCPAKG